MSDSDVVTGVRRPVVARHRGRDRVPVETRRRFASLPHLQLAAFQHHRGDHRTEIQQVRSAAQLGNIRLNKKIHLKKNKKKKQKKQ